MRCSPPVCASALQNLFDRIFVADPEQRISMDGIMHHPWFLTNCPADLQAARLALCRLCKTLSDAK